jgi:hypothetical protein
MTSITLFISTNYCFKVTAGQTKLLSWMWNFGQSLVVPIHSKGFVHWKFYRAKELAYTCFFVAHCVCTLRLWWLMCVRGTALPFLKH